jgi:protein involved in polysaccharide export with SLBB domain
MIHKPITFATLLILMISGSAVAEDTASPGDSVPTAFEVAADLHVQLAEATEDYPCTPGDQYLLTYLSHVGTVSTIFTVEGDYTINMGVFGTKSVESLAFPELRKSAKAIVSRAYPESYPRLGLLKTGSFRVFLDGEVVSASWETVWGLSRVGDIFLPERLTSYSSLRDVRVTDQAGRSRYYDLFRATRLGELDENPYLKRGDVVTVGKARRRVSIVGEVTRSGSYQLKSGDTLKDLIEFYADGLSPTADPARILIERQTGAEAIAEVMEIDLTDTGSESVRLLDLDRVSVASSLARLPVVYIEGAVRTDEVVREGSAVPDGRIRYRLRKGDTLYTVMSSIRGSIESGANLAQSVVINPSTSLQRIVDVEYLLYSGDRSTDITLSAEDRIIIPRGDFEVFLTGEVRNSAWITANQYTRLSSLLSDRLTGYSSNRDIRITSRSGEESEYDLFRAGRFGEVDQNPYLKPGDVVTVSKAPRRVTIGGEVKRPGTYQLQLGQTLDELISFYADGYSLMADPGTVFINRRTDDDAIAEVIEVDLTATDPGSVRLLDSDRVSVGNSLSLLPVIYIEGAVLPDGRIRHRLREGDTLYTVMSAIRDSIDPGANLAQCVITNPTTKEQRIVDVEYLLYSGDRSNDVGLTPEDRIVVPTGDFQVFLTGEVRNSAWISTNQYTRLSSLLADRLTGYSSNRNITITSRSREVVVYDLFRAGRFGEVDQNPYLKPGDLVTVAKAPQRVTIDGEVKRSGTYQLRPGETLEELIQFYADGFSLMADRETILISRQTDTEAIAVVIEIDLSVADPQSVTLVDLDHVSVSSTLTRLPVVYIEGAVVPAGKIRHRLREGDTLYTVMSSIRGSIDPAANLAQCVITNPRTSEQRMVDVEYLLYSGDRSTDIDLSAEDRIVIPIGDFQVFLTGEVRNSAWITANQYTRLSSLLSDRLTGYSSNRDITIASRSGETSTYDLFRAGRFGEIDQNPYLKPGDVVTVAKAPTRVTIGGEVKRPGTYQMQPGETLEQLIAFYADDYSHMADSGTVFINRTTGVGTIAEVIELDLTQTDPGTVSLLDLDGVSIGNTLSRLPVIYIEGAVQPAGRIRHRLREGDTLYTVMSSIRGSIEPTANLAQCVITNPMTSEQRMVDVEYLLYSGDRSGDIDLSAEDRIVVPTGDFQVFLTGEVKKSAWISANQYTRLSVLISDRLTGYSSNRDVTITSRSGKASVYDLFRAGRFGEIAQDPYLKPGDVVTVNRVVRKVTVLGEVEKPGTYQLLENENLVALIEVYGDGLTMSAYAPEMKINRFDVTGESIAKRLYLDFSSDADRDAVLANGDQVSVGNKLRYLETVIFEGAVFTHDERTASTELEGSNSFEYDFLSGEMLSEAVAKAETRFSDVSDLQNAYIILADGSRVDVDLERLLRDTTAVDDVQLTDHSRIIIPFRQYFVIVAGAVMNPTRYPYIPDRDADYYVDLAGGFNPERHAGSRLVIYDNEGNVLRRNAEIGPEHKIVVPSNSVLYLFGRISAIVSAAASITALVLSLIR